MKRYNTFLFENKELILADKFYSIYLTEEEFKKLSDDEKNRYEEEIDKLVKLESYMVYDCSYTHRDLHNRTYVDIDVDEDDISNYLEIDDTMLREYIELLDNEYKFSEFRLNAYLNTEHEEILTKIYKLFNIKSPDEDTFVDMIKQVIFYSKHKIIEDTLDEIISYIESIYTQLMQIVAKKIDESLTYLYFNIVGDKVRMTFNLTIMADDFNDIKSALDNMSKNISKIDDIDTDVDINEKEKNIFDSKIKKQLETIYEYMKKNTEKIANDLLPKHSFYIKEIGGDFYDNIISYEWQKEYLVNGRTKNEYSEKLTMLDKYNELKSNNLINDDIVLEFKYLVAADEFNI